MTISSERVTQPPWSEHHHTITILSPPSCISWWEIIPITPHHVHVPISPYQDRIPSWTLTPPFQRPHQLPCLHLGWNQRLYPTPQPLSTISPHNYTSSTTHLQNIMGGSEFSHGGCVPLHQVHSNHSMTQRHRFHDITISWWWSITLSHVSNDLLVMVRRSPYSMERRSTQVIIISHIAHHIQILWYFLSWQNSMNYLTMIHSVGTT